MSKIRKVSINSKPNDIIENNQTEYIVEKILDVRTVRGMKQYFVKWTNSTHTKTSWEPKESLECTDLIEEFKKLHKNNCRRKRKRSTSSDNTDSDYELPKSKQRKLFPKNGFEKGYKAKEILGACEFNGKLAFLIQWEDDHAEPEIIPASIANKRCPYELISFYEERLFWKMCPDVFQNVVISMSSIRHVNH